MDIIEIGYICSDNAEKYIFFSLQSILKTCTEPKNLSILIGINTYQYNSSVFNPLRDKFFSFTEYNTHSDYSHPSMNHGYSVDLLFYNYFKHEIGMIVDSDIVFLKKNWDSILLRQLSNKNIIIGAGNPNYKISPTYNKYQKFPSIYVCMFLTKKLLNLNITWQPFSFNLQEKKINTIYTKKNNIPYIFNIDNDIVNSCIIPNKFEIESLMEKGLKHTVLKIKVGGSEKILSMNHNDICRCDTSFFIPFIIKKNNFDGIYLQTNDVIKNINKTTLFSENKLNEVSYTYKNNKLYHNPLQNMFEIYFKNKIFFSHLGQSSNRNFDTDIISNYWCNSINNYLIVETIKPFALSITLNNYNLILSKFMKTYIISNVFKILDIKKKADKEYLLNNPDLSKTEWEKKPFYHFKKYGASEGRKYGIIKTKLKNIITQVIDILNNQNKFIMYIHKNKN